MSASTHGAGNAVEITFNATVAPLTSPPFDPRMVRVKFPDGTLLDAVNVRVEEPESVTVGGVNTALIPGGRLVMLNTTGPLKPFNAATCTVKLVVESTKIICPAGVAESRKLFGPVTLNSTGAKLLSGEVPPRMFGNRPLPC